MEDPICALGSPEAPPIGFVIQREGSLRALCLCNANDPGNGKEPFLTPEQIEANGLFIEQAVNRHAALTAKLERAERELAGARRECIAWAERWIATMSHLEWPHSFTASEPGVYMDLLTVFKDGNFVRMFTKVEPNESEDAPYPCIEWRKWHEEHRWCGEWPNIPFKDYADYRAQTEVLKSRVSPPAALQPAADGAADGVGKLLTETPTTENALNNALVENERLKEALRTLRKDWNDYTLHEVVDAALGAPKK